MRKAGWKKMRVEGEEEGGLNSLQREVMSHKVCLCPGDGGNFKNAHFTLLRVFSPNSGMGLLG